MLTKYGIPILALLALAFAAASVARLRPVESKVEPDLPPPSASFKNKVGAVALVEASSENIAVSLPVPGLVTAVFVKAGDRVQKGQHLFSLDDREIRAEMVLRESNLLGGLTSAFLLGAAMSAMLMGHNYLVAPAMSLTPLFRLLAALAVALALRAVADGVALADWAQAHSFDTLKVDAMLWLPVRWLVGIAGPAAMCWMAWQTARIRSTQSATGILYVAVILCFLGELTGMLLRPLGVVL